MYNRGVGGRRKQQAARMLGEIEKKIKDKKVVELRNQKKGGERRWGC